MLAPGFRALDPCPRRVTAALLANSSYHDYMRSRRSGGRVDPPVHLPRADGRQRPVPGLSRAPTAPQSDAALGPIGSPRPAPPPATPRPPQPPPAPPPYRPPTA